MKKQNLKSKSQVHSFLNQAQEAYEAMEYLKAVDFYKKALKIKEEDESTLNSLGRCFDQYALTLKDKGACNSAQKKALVFHRKVLKINPSSAQALAGTGTVYHHQGNLKKALGFYKEALALQPKKPEILNDIGNVFQRKGNFQKAQNYYQKALKLNPKFSGAWFNLAFLYKKMGKNQEALNAAQKFVKLSKKKKGTKLTSLFKKQIKQDIIEAS